MVVLDPLTEEEEVNACPQKAHSNVEDLRAVFKGVK